VNVPFLDLSRQTRALAPELATVIEATLSESRFVLGEAVERFEDAFASFCGGANAVGVASGADAIAVALRAVGVEPGGEVVTAANTCRPTIVGIERASAKPVLADVDRATLTLDPAAAEAAITPRTAALLPVHLYGQCADMPALRDVATRNGVKLVEDAAQAHGAEVSGKRAGTLGDAAAFSFYPTKNLGALGDGGAVVTNDAGIADAARRARHYVGDAARTLATVAGSSRLDTLQAAVLTAKLAHLDAWTERRRELATTYRERLRDTELRLPVEAPERSHVYHLFVVRVRERDALRAQLAERGIETLVHYPQPVHAARGYEDLASLGSLPESEAAAAEVVSLPLYPELTDAEIDAVVSALLER
jgi:dTDP-4-amino-4,6-dideoxygalactose transaminase